MGAVRKKVESLFDYCGDIAKNASSLNANTYSATYSPNNIRAVVISPNGVLVRYHLSSAGTGGRSFKYVEFNERDLYIEESEPRYKPILSLLASPLICQSVEEIVVLRKSILNNTHQLFMNEIRLESLVASWKGQGTDVQTKITGRFKRLRYYTVLDASFKEFIAYFMGVGQSGELKKYQFISELPGIQGIANKTELAGKDYWKFYGNQSDSYVFDATLAEHFKKIIARNESAARDAAVDEMRSKRVGGKIEAINDLIKEYLTYNRLWRLYCNIIKKEGGNGVLAGLDFVLPVEDVYLAPFKGMSESFPKEFYRPGEKMREDEALTYDETVLRNYKLRCAKALALNLLTGLDQLTQEEDRVLLKTLLYGCESIVAVPPEGRSINEKLHQLTGFSFDGKNIDSSISNSCYLFMRFFVACEHTEPLDRGYWESKISGAKRRV